jgi:tRNA A-37 threonylcarbamoyl transferase component Bud32
MIGATHTADASPRLEVNPAFAPLFASLGLETPSRFLDLPGDVVSGHPDRHVVRVELSGRSTAFYLKRQHHVTRGEKLHNWLQGFGWVSRCEREGSLLKQLSAAELPCPRWAAVGSDRTGRAFLLVEEVTGAADLRQALPDLDTTPEGRVRFFRKLGCWIAAYHQAGFTTPELAAKHVLVDPPAHFTLLDWQSAKRVAIVPMADRLRSLAALHASTAEKLATPRERLRVLWHALRPARQAGLCSRPFTDLVRQVQAAASRISGRRSLQNQRQANTSIQRLVWVAGEEVCAVPDVAAIWPERAISPPFYGCAPGSELIRLADGREALVTRGRSFAPLGRLWASLRGRSWRSPGVSLGRVLFHLERYGIPAPRLLAFGQRPGSAGRAEWFALHTPPPPALTPPLDERTAVRLGRLLRALHEAGCRFRKVSLDFLGECGEELSVRDVTALYLGRRDPRAELAAWLGILPAHLREAVKTSYEQG